MMAAGNGDFSEVEVGMMNNQDMAYIARKPCGCVVCAYVDDPSHRKDTAKEVSNWIKWGLAVERVTIEYANQHFTWDCPHKPEVQQLSLFKSEAVEKPKDTTC